MRTLLCLLTSNSKPQHADASSPAEVTLRHALRVLLTVVAFQSQITAFGGRATEDRLQAAQQALAELQGAAHTVPAGLGMGQRAALAGLTHFCSALYALSLEDGRAALSHLGHAADALQSGAHPLRLAVECMHAVQRIECCNCNTCLLVAVRPPRPALHCIADTAMYELYAAAHAPAADNLEFIPDTLRLQVGTDLAAATPRFCF